MNTFSTFTSAEAGRGNENDLSGEKEKPTNCSNATSTISSGECEHGPRKRKRLSRTIKRSVTLAGERTQQPAGYCTERTR